MDVNTTSETLLTVEEMARSGDSAALADYLNGPAGDTMAWFTGAVLLWCLIIGLAVYIVNAVFLAGIFKKAGVAAWKAWIPIYNMVKFLQIGGYSGWWILLCWISPVNTVLFALAAYEIGKKLGKSNAGWIILYIFLGIIWTGILGLDESKWHEKLGRKSLAPEKSPA